MEITQDCTLFLDDDKIKIKKGLKVNLIVYTKDKNLVRNVEIDLGKNSILNLYQFNLGSKKNKIKVVLNESSSYNLKSVYYIKNSLSEMLNVANHTGKNSKSNLVINGCVMDKAIVANDGLIEIDKKATGCQGHQKMTNLILDDSSKVESEPVLKVENNDVVCSHGSSISQIKDNILFYIESRGISKEEAQKLYVQGFLDFVLSDLDKKVREEICIEL